MDPNLIRFLYNSEYGFASYFLNLQRTEKVICWSIQNSVIYAEKILNYYENHIIKWYIEKMTNSADSKYSITTEIILQELINEKKEIDRKHSKDINISLVDIMNLKTLKFLILNYNPPINVLHVQYAINPYIYIINEHLASKRYYKDLDVNFEDDLVLINMEYRLYQTSVYILPNKNHILTMFRTLEENGFEMEDVKIIGNNEYIILSILDDRTYLFFSTPNMNSISKSSYYKPGGHIFSTVASPTQNIVTKSKNNISNAWISKEEFCLQLYVCVLVDDHSRQNDADREKLRDNQLDRINLILNSNNPELYLYITKKYITCDYNINTLLTKVSTIKYLKSYNDSDNTLFTVLKNTYNQSKLISSNATNLVFYIKYPKYQNTLKSKILESFLKYNTFDVNNSIIQWGFFIDDAMCELDLSILSNRDLFYSTITSLFLKHRKVIWIMHINNKLHSILIESSPCDNITLAINKKLLLSKSGNFFELYNESAPMAFVGFSNSNLDSENYIRLTPISIYHKQFGIIVIPNIKFILPWTFDQYEHNLKYINSDIRNLFCKESDILKLKDNFKNFFRPSIISINNQTTFHVNQDIKILKYYYKVNNNVKNTFYIMYSNKINNTINNEVLVNLIKTIENILTTKHCLTEIDDSDAIALLEINKFLTSVQLNFNN